jgi:threonine synthase
MGLPVRILIMPTNENDEFPNYLRTGVYEKVSPSRACLSNAMNVGHPSNLARFFELYGGTVDRRGAVHAYPDLKEMRRHIFSVSVSDEETRKTIRSVYERYNILLEPHGAVGWKGLEHYLEACCGSVDDPCICLETAHPAKFPDEVIELLGITPEVPQSMKDLDKRTGAPVELPAEYSRLRSFLLDTLKGTD